MKEYKCIECETAMVNIIGKSDYATHDRACPNEKCSRYGLVTIVYKGLEP